jgi:hypothetical protein
VVSLSVRILDSCLFSEPSAMAMNQIQFQPGLSMPEFFDLYGTQPQCALALERARWPNGFRCPRCQGAAHCVLRGGTFKVFQCDACRHQTSLIAGTVFQGTKMSLSVWFLAIYLISQAKTGLSALALKRHLGVSYPTAWLMHHKLMLSMATREDRYVLCGDVQVDDAYTSVVNALAARPGGARRTRFPSWRLSRSPTPGTHCASSSTSYLDLP